MAEVISNFSDIITFSRSSSATRYNSAGVLTSAAINEPRFDYDPVTLQPRGILIEEQRTNLLTYSGNIDSTNYDVALVTLTANATVSPDNTASASLLSPTTANNGHFTYRNPPQLSYTSGASYSLSIFAKNSGGRYLQLTFPSGAFGASQYANFDLQDGVLGTATQGTASITPVGNGWFRCSFAATATVSASASNGVIALIQSATSSRAPAFVGVPANGIYIWGAQLEAGAFPTSYIPTVASQVTRSADVASVNTLSPWYNATEGTLFVEGSTFKAGSAYYAALSSNSGNYILIRQQDSSRMEMRVTVGAEQQSVLDAGVTNALGAVSKNAGSYGADSFAYAVNGSLVGSDSSGAVPSTTSLSIGGASFGAKICGHIRTIRYFPRKLANSELQAITV